MHQDAFDMVLQELHEKFGNPFSFSLKLETSNQDAMWGAIAAICPKPDVDGIAFQGSGLTIDRALLDLIVSMRINKNVISEEG